MDNIRFEDFNKLISLSSKFMLCKAKRSHSSIYKRENSQKDILIYILV